MYPSRPEVSSSLPPFDEHLFALETQYRERVWGGQRLKAVVPPIGEAWIAYGPSKIARGRFAGQTVDEVMALHGAKLLGTAVANKYGSRFPILIKLLDCADWLSVQVHPNDAQARRMVGPDEFGKTEAWYFLSADPGARIMIGVKPGVGRTELAARIRAGRVLEVADQVSVHDGDSVLIPAGTLHALGPGLLLYEIQQASDTTYRVYDWDRPQSAGRKLHIEESVEVTVPVGPEELKHPAVKAETGVAPAIECPLFRVDLVRVSSAGGPLATSTGGRSFHLVTVVDGAAEIVCGAEQIGLGRFETALVAGSAGEYEIRSGNARATVLRATVPD
jgi:mannose-6-phosphate isomerase